MVTPANVTPSREHDVIRTRGTKARLVLLFAAHSVWEAVNPPPPHTQQGRLFSYGPRRWGTALARRP